jgi:hypothetical protein
LNGAVIGYTGPALPSLADPGGGSFWGPPLLLRDQEASWITSLLSIGCFVGGTEFFFVFSIFENVCMLTNPVQIFKAGFFSQIIFL